MIVAQAIESLPSMHEQQIITQYRNFEILEHFLTHPKSLATQLIFYLAPQTRSTLISSYYKIDGRICRELLGKKLTHRVRYLDCVCKSWLFGIVRIWMILPSRPIDLCFYVEECLITWNELPNVLRMRKKIWFMYGKYLLIICRLLWPIFYYPKSSLVNTQTLSFSTIIVWIQQKESL